MTDWQPGLDIDELTIGAVMEQLHAEAQRITGDQPEDIPWQVRLLENPASPLPMPGRMTLARHDPLHAILGRGITLRDECFVLGFTIGATVQTRKWHFPVYWFVYRFLNPRGWRLNPGDWAVLLQGVQVAKSSGARELQDIAFETWHGLTVAQARTRLGIDKEVLRKAYEIEQSRFGSIIFSSKEEMAR